MNLNFRFAIISDLHIALPQTIWDHPRRFHLVELSIPALESILDHLIQLDLDFLLLPGDLTQHGEQANHRWLVNRLAELPFPTYVVPGNHDVIQLEGDDRVIGLADFPHYYQKFGYCDSSQLYYTCEVLSGVRLIGLNSNQFTLEGEQLGCLDAPQLDWLRQVLADHPNDLMLVMVHHNLLEHMPGQADSELGRRYLLDNRVELLETLQAAGVQLVFTGHLHMQDIAQSGNLYDITTGSIVTYPHPYRLLHFHRSELGQSYLNIESPRVQTLPGRSDLQHSSREWMAERSLPFVAKFLSQSPLGLSPDEVETFAPDLRYFWADLVSGDAQFRFPHLPARVRQYFESFSALDEQGQAVAIDNSARLLL